MNRLCLRLPLLTFTILCFQPLYAQFALSPDGELKFAMADPESNWELFALLRDAQIRSELNVTEEVAGVASKSYSNVQEEVNEYMLNARQTTPRPDNSEIRQFVEGRKSQAASAIEELLTPDQQARLKQIAYRMEAVYIGFDHALTSGRLGKAAGVYDNQKHALSLRIRDLNAEALDAISKILVKLEEDVLEELSPEQRDRAKALLGKPFVYHKQSHEDIALTKMRELAASRKAEVKDEKN